VFKTAAQLLSNAVVLKAESIRIVLYKYSIWCRLAKYPLTAGRCRSVHLLQESSWCLSRRKAEDEYRSCWIAMYAAATSSFQFQWSPHPVVVVMYRSRAA
jgi:hypothetical protein